MSETEKTDILSVKELRELIEEEEEEEKRAKKALREKFSIEIKQISIELINEILREWKEKIIIESVEIEYALSFDDVNRNYKNKNPDLTFFYVPPEEFETIVSEITDGLISGGYQIRSKINLDALPKYTAELTISKNKELQGT